MRQLAVAAATAAIVLVLLIDTTGLQTTRADDDPPIGPDGWSAAALALEANDRPVVDEKWVENSWNATPILVEGGAAEADLEAALAHLAAEARAAADADHGGPAARPVLLGLAVLGDPVVRGRLDDRQAHLAAALLVRLLEDRAVVSDDRPACGMLRQVRHEAAAILESLAGRNLGSLHQEGGMRAMAPGEATDELAADARTVEAWRTWWKIAGGRPAADWPRD